jgi:hypothetical protein
MGTGICDAVLGVGFMPLLRLQRINPAPLSGSNSQNPKSVISFCKMAVLRLLIEPHGRADILIFENLATNLVII